MLSWVELAALKNETEIAAAIDALAPNELASLISDLSQITGITSKQQERGSLRILIERARPFAISASSWRRPLWSSDPPEPPIHQHLTSVGQSIQVSLVESLIEMQVRFATKRPARPIGSIYLEQLLQNQDYRCVLCGMRFYHDELVTAAILSPYGFRPNKKQDRLKAHWSEDRLREPKVDHIWPVSGYGNSDLTNLQAICQGCNDGKEDYVFLEQTRKYVGILTHEELHGTSPAISTRIFVAQMWRQPFCVDTGVSARDAELTVRIKDPRFASVLDNLETIVSPD